MRLYAQKLFLPMAVILFTGFIVCFYLYMTRVAKIKESERQTRYAMEEISLIWNYRDSALRGETAEAADFLFQLQSPPPGKKDFDGQLGDLVKMERKRAQKEVIAYLRAKTGKDLGGEPKLWILEYADEAWKSAEDACKF